MKGGGGKLRKVEEAEREVEKGRERWREEEEEEKSEISEREVPACKVMQCDRRLQRVRRSS